MSTTILDEATRRLKPERQSLDDAYSPPANFLEIEVSKPETHGLVGKKRYTDYQIRMKTNIPVFKKKECTVRRRYSDFQWLRNELKRSVQIVIPELPGKAIGKQLPLINKDDGIFEEGFIEERRAGLEEFINIISGHPLVQNEKCLHMFLQVESAIDKDNYVPGKIGYN